MSDQEEGEQKQKNNNQMNEKDSDILADQDENYLKEQHKNEQKEENQLQQSSGNKEKPEEHSSDDEIQQKQEENNAKKSNRRNSTRKPKRKQKKGKKFSIDEDSENLQKEEEEKDNDEQKQDNGAEQQQYEKGKQLVKQEDDEEEEESENRNEDDKQEEEQQQQFQSEKQKKFEDNKKNFKIIDMGRKSQNKDAEDDFNWKKSKEEKVQKQEEQQNFVLDLTLKNPKSSTNEPSATVGHGKIKDYILHDFQEVEIIKKKELNKYKKQMTLDGDGDLRYQKKNEASFQGENLLPVTKEPKKTRGIIEFFTNSAKRYIFLENHMMYVLQKKSGNSYIVKSISKLEDLFKIYVEKNSKKLTMAFYNEQKDCKQLPKHKKFTVNDVQVFLSLVKAEITTLGCDLIYK